jgi:hypothetical protein
LETKTLKDIDSKKKVTITCLHTCSVLFIQISKLKVTEMIYVQMNEIKNVNLIIKVRPFSENFLSRLVQKPDEFEKLNSIV